MGFPLDIPLLLLLGFSYAFAQQASEAVDLTGSGAIRGKGPEQVAYKTVSADQDYRKSLALVDSDESRMVKEEKAAQALKSSEADRAGSKIERWYTYWALGYSHMAYTGKMNGRSIGLSWWEEDLPVYDREYALGVDLFGLYLPLKNRQTLVGAVYNLAIDHRSESMINSSLWEKWKGHQLSVSTMHFFKSIGRGPFVRADLGFGWITGHNQKKEQLLSAADSGGLAGLFGFGYSFPIEDLGGRILLNLDYFITPAVDFAQLEGDVRGFSVRVGGLF